MENTKIIFHNLNLYFIFVVLKHRNFVVTNIILRDYAVEHHVLLQTVNMQQLGKKMV